MGKKKKPAVALAEHSQHPEHQPAQSVKSKSDRTDQTMCLPTSTASDKDTFAPAESIRNSGASPAPSAGKASAVLTAMDPRNVVSVISDRVTGNTANGNTAGDTADEASWEMATGTKDQPMPAPAPAKPSAPLKASEVAANGDGVAAPATEPVEAALTVVVLGDAGVGKTALLGRLSGRDFEVTASSTVHAEPFDINLGVLSKVNTHMHAR